MGHNKLTQTDYDSKEYRLSAMQRFKEKTKLQPSGCIEWQGPLYPTGYGIFAYAGHSKRAHRVSWMLANNRFDIKPEDFVCHTCDNRKCVNPDHLWLGNNSENQLDSSRKGGHARDVYWKKRTSCKKGHPYTEGSLRFDMHGWRRCKICQEGYRLVHVAKRKAAYAATIIKG